MATHEDFSRTSMPRFSGNRAFGLVFATAFAVVGLSPLLAHGSIRVWALAISVFFLLLAMVAPALLSSANRLWQFVGQLLQRIVSPLTLVLLFYAIITPMGVLMRVFSRSGRRWRRDAAAGTYWVPRRPPGPDPESLRNQF